MKRCYVCGPMSRRKRRHVEDRFNAAARVLRATGWDVMLPTQSEERDRASFVRRDLDMIQSLEAYTEDAVVVLPGHELTGGCHAEVAVARWLRLRVLTLEEALDDDI